MSLVARYKLDNSESNPGYNSAPMAIAKFLSSGSFTVPGGVYSLEVLVVAGGGGGGSSGGLNVPGGGGGGGVIYVPAYAVTPGQVITATVGNGGARGASGQNSVFGTQTAIGGGYGGFETAAGLPAAGGSGGGGCYINVPKTGGAGTAGQGFAGGSGGNAGDTHPAGGGGGAGGPGVTGVNAQAAAGAGGPGMYHMGTYWGAGGGGGGWSGTSVASAGGLGGGGKGGYYNTDSATAGMTNTGSGGGGGYTSTLSKSGGSGIIIVRYARPTSNAVAVYDMFKFDAVGKNSFYVPYGVGSIEYAIVGGGGGGANTGSGGGGGGMLTGTITVASGQRLLIEVGAGGIGGVATAAAGSQGGSSSLTVPGQAAITASGGGYGISHGGANGIAGGSGGGAPIRTVAPAGTGGAGIAGQGYAGGNGYVEAGWVGCSGGGGGAGGVGANGGNTVGAGNGGPGRLFYGVYYAGGGGGGDLIGTTVKGAGGVGGGGSAVQDAPGEAGVNGLGGGGAGGGYNSAYYTGGNGGSGAVILRWSAYSDVNAAMDAQAFSLRGAGTPLCIRHYPLTADPYDGSAHQESLYRATAYAPYNLSGQPCTAFGTEALRMQTRPVQRVNGQPLTVSLWMYQTSHTAYQGLIFNRDQDGAVDHLNWGLFTHTTDGSLQLHTSAQNKSTYIPPLNTWVHVIATVSRGMIYKLYINNVLTQTVAAVTYGGVTPTALHVGGSSPNGELFQGYLRDIYILNAEVDSELRTALYTNMNEWTAYALACHGSSYGGMYFNKTSYLQFPQACNPSGSGFSLMFWACMGPDLGTFYNSVLRISNSLGYILNIHFPWTDDIVYFDTGDGSGGYDRTTKTATASALKHSWSHWAFIRDSIAGTMAIYLNGSLWHFAGSLYMHTGIHTAGAQFGLGWQGWLADIQVYDTPLPRKAVEWIATGQELSTMQTTEIDDGLTLHYKMADRAESSNNLQTGGSGYLIIYNNYAMPATLRATGETYKGSPVMRLTMMAHVESWAADFRAVYGNHGVFQPESPAYAASVPYVCSIYWRPVTHPDTLVNGSPANIGWSGSYNDPKQSDGWTRSVSYRDGSDATARSDNKFWGVMCPSYVVGQSIIVDFAAPQKEQYKTLPSVFTLASSTSTIIDSAGVSHSRPTYDICPSWKNEGPLRLGCYSFLSTSKILISTFYRSHGSYTILVWIKPKVALIPVVGDNTNRRDVFRASPNWNPGLWLTSNRLRVHAQTEFRDSVISITDTNWHQVGMIWDHITQTVYAIFDGAILALGTRTAYEPGTPDRSLHLGNVIDAPPTAWLGDMADFRYYATKFTAAKVTAQYSPPVMETDDKGNLWV